jgi:hypothetical protein
LAGTGGDKVFGYYFDKVDAGNPRQPFVNTDGDRETHVGVSYLFWWDYSTRTMLRMVKPEDDGPNRFGQGRDGQGWWFWRPDNMIRGHLSNMQVYLNGAYRHYVAKNNQSNFSYESGRHPIDVNENLGRWSYIGGPVQIWMWEEPNVGAPPNSPPLPVPATPPSPPPPPPPAVPTSITLWRDVHRKELAYPEMMDQLIYFTKDQYPTSYAHNPHIDAYNWDGRLTSYQLGGLTKLCVNEQTNHYQYQKFPNSWTHSWENIIAKCPTIQTPFLYLLGWPGDKTFGVYFDKVDAGKHRQSFNNSFNANHVGVSYFFWWDYETKTMLRMVKPESDGSLSIGGNGYWLTAPSNFIRGRLGDMTYCWSRGYYRYYVVKDNQSYFEHEAGTHPLQVSHANTNYCGRWLYGTVQLWTWEEPDGQVPVTPP